MPLEPPLVEPNLRRLSPVETTRSANARWLSPVETTLPTNACWLSLSLVLRAIEMKPTSPATNKIA